MSTALGLLREFLSPDSLPALLAGEVVGEAPGIGLWIRLDTVAVGGGPHDLFPDLAKERPRRLIRWEYIRAAEMFDDRIEMDQVVGFRPHA